MVEISRFHQFQQTLAPVKIENEMDLGKMLLKGNIISWQCEKSIFVGRNRIRMTNFRF